MHEAPGVDDEDEGAGPFGCPAETTWLAAGSLRGCFNAARSELDCG